MMRKCVPPSTFRQRRERGAEGEQFDKNGRHERMHLTLKMEATKPAAANTLQQQARFDTFLERLNHERPHQALGMKVPPTSTHRPHARIAGSWR